MSASSSKKIITAEAVLRIIPAEASVVFTNGCFDILHPGHVDYLERARKLGTHLVVGLNSDASIRRLKGPARPVNTESDRARVLAGLGCVNHVIIFDEDTPLELIRTIGPHVLVKGGDWPVEQIVGREVILERGGQVLSLPLLPGQSTTNIVQRILSLHQKDVSHD